jgi:hypothetical protein
VVGGGAAVGTAAGAQPRKPRGGDRGEGEGHWHPAFAVRAVGVQPRACASRKGTLPDYPRWGLPLGPGAQPRKPRGGDQGEGEGH